MDKVDFVLVGSEAVVESGGLINATGSNQIAIIAKHANKPFYALAERYVISSVLVDTFSCLQPQFQIPPPVSTLTVRPPDARAGGTAFPASCAASWIRDERRRIG